MIDPPRFTYEDAERAHSEWGANCGPTAVAAISRLTLDELRPHMGSFEKKKYTNPKLMWEVLDALFLENAILAWEKSKSRSPTWPDYGLCRIQWHGPWTEPGMPKRVAYRHTHWVGAARRGNTIGVYDINAMQPHHSGWVREDHWAGLIVPYILEICEPKASGRWSITHAVEVALP